MALFFVETRELRSFRMRSRIKELSTVLENKNTEAVFCVTNFLGPNVRKELRSQFNQDALLVTSISKNIIRFLFANNAWQDFRSLLEGQIFLLRNKNNTTSFTRKFLVTLTKDEKFTLRLFLYKHQLYRRERLKLLLTGTEQKIPASSIFFMLKEFLFRRTILSSAKRLSTNSI